MKCRYLKKYGHDSCADPPHFNGGFAEYCYITPGTGVIKIPDELSDLEAAPANCALATVVAGWESAGLRPFENVLIQGAGALGLYAAALARHYGCQSYHRYRHPGGPAGGRQGFWSNGHDQYSRYARR
jgi:D-arabinose 1-dehydrogenase-like Zn-dependent alcohol dehydrogenase